MKKFMNLKALRSNIFFTYVQIY